MTKELHRSMERINHARLTKAQASEIENLCNKIDALHNAIKAMSSTPSKVSYHPVYGGPPVYIPDGATVDVQTRTGKLTVSVVRDADDGEVLKVRAERRIKVHPYCSNVIHLTGEGWE